MTRPTDCTTSMTELRGLRNMTASSAGTSTPSDRQRALERIRQVFVGRIGLEPIEQRAAAEGVEGAVHVVGFKFEHASVVGMVFFVGGHDLGGFFDEGFAILDAAGEGDRPAHGLDVAL